MSNYATQQDLLNGAKDLQTVAEVATSLNQTTTDRLGNTKLTLSGAFAKLGFYAPVAFTSGLVVTTSSTTVTNDGNTYFANPEAVPFTTTSTFNPAHWKMFNQEFAGAEIAQISTYSLLRAYAGAATLVYVAGRLNDQDGAANFYVVDESDTTSPDNDGTVLVDTIGRRWKVQGRLQNTVNDDVFRLTSPSLSARRYIPTRIGTSPNNVVQSAAVDSVNNYLYTYHVSTTFSPPTEFAVINRYYANDNAIQTAHVSTVPTAAIGHQGLAIQNLGNGAVKFWASAPYGSGLGNYAVSFDIQVNSLTAGGAEVVNTQQYKFFNTTDSSQSCTPCVSWDGQYLLVEQNGSKDGLDGNYIRVFRLSEIGVAGDYTNKFLREFFVRVTHGTTPVAGLQSMACDGESIFVLAGSSSVSEKHTIAQYTMDGRLIAENRNLSVGKTDATATGAGTFYEPESLFFGLQNGQKQLFLQIAAGDAGARSCFIYALGARGSIRGQAGNGVPAFVSVGDTDFAVPSGEAMTFGAWDMQVYSEYARFDLAGRWLYGNQTSLSIAPTGNARQQIVGDSAKSSSLAARFDASSAGVRHVFYKSRSATVGGTSKLLTNDQIAVISFVGDDGAADYSSSAGVIGAEIRAVLESDSSVGVMPARLELWTNGTRRWQVTSGGNFNPATDNAFNIGNGSQRVKEIFAATATINTSDDRTKTYLEITDAEKAVALELKANMRKFKFNDAIELKGNNARIHFGASAQTVKAIFESHGLDATNYGLLCYDEWEEERDEEGNVTLEAGNRYGIRYEELLSFIISAM